MSGSVCYASGSGEAVQNMHTTKEEKKEKGEDEGEDEGEETIYHRNPIWEDHLREEGKTLVNDSVNNDVRDGVSLSLPNPLASASKEQSDWLWRWRWRWGLTSAEESGSSSAVCDGGPEGSA